MSLKSGEAGKAFRLSHVVWFRVLVHPGILPHVPDQILGDATKRQLMAGDFGFRVAKTI